MESVWCVQCHAAMNVLDGHNCCPSCLGINHLREALTNPCPACSMMPLEMRRLRLAGLTADSDATLPPSGVTADDKKRKAAEPLGGKARKKRSSPDMARKLAELSSTVEQLQALLSARPAPAERLQTSQVLAPPPALPQRSAASFLERDADALSVAASESLFAVDSASDYGEEEPAAGGEEERPPSTRSLSGSGSESHSTASASNASALPIQNTLKVALARLKLDVPQAAPGSSNLLRRPAGASDELRMPQCPDFTGVLTESFGMAMASRPDRTIRALAAMVEPDSVGLGRMPTVEPCIASLIISPDEALRQVVRCPNPECRRTDDLLGRTYSATASLGRVGNSLAHLLLAMHTSLSSTADATVTELMNASLQALGAIASDCGRALGLLVQARRQVWLAQSPLPEPCRNSLRALPLLPGQIFGPAAQEALERRMLVSETRNRLIGSRPVFRRPTQAPQPRRRDLPVRQQAAPYRAPPPRPAQPRPPVPRGHASDLGQSSSRQEPQHFRLSGAPLRRRPPKGAKTTAPRR